MGFTTRRHNSQWCREPNPHGHKYTYFPPSAGPTFTPMVPHIRRSRRRGRHGRKRKQVVTPQSTTSASLAALAWSYYLGQHSVGFNTHLLDYITHIISFAPDTTKALLLVPVHPLQPWYAQYVAPHGDRYHCHTFLRHILRFVKNRRTFLEVTPVAP